MSISLLSQSEVSSEYKFFEINIIKINIIKSGEENKSYVLSTNPNQPALLTEEEINNLKK